MASAKKCDRCGALYEMPVNPILRIEKDLYPYEPKYIDLCPQCYEELKKWLENEQYKLLKEAQNGRF